MPDIPSPWDAYLRLQNRSRKIHKVDSYSWGFEEEMNLFLENPDAACSKGLARKNAAAARRARDQAKMRKDRVSELTPEPFSLERQMEARETLRQIRTVLPPQSWSLLLDVAAGYSYEEIAGQRQVKPGTLRVLASRLRNQLAHHSIAA